MLIALPAPSDVPSMIVPAASVALVPGVRSRTRGQVASTGELFGPTTVMVQPVSINAALICALRWMGLAEFSGPGAPKIEATPPYVPPFVETKTKSAALLSVSCGVPEVSLRTKAYSPSFAPGEGRFVPSRKRLENVPEPLFRLTASRRVVVEKFALFA